MWVIHHLLAQEVLRLSPTLNLKTGGRPGQSRSSATGQLPTFCAHRLLTQCRVRPVIRLCGSRSVAKVPTCRTLADAHHRDFHARSRSTSARRPKGIPACGSSTGIQRSAQDRGGLRPGGLTKCDADHCAQAPARRDCGVASSLELLRTWHKWSLPRCHTRERLRMNDYDRPVSEVAREFALQLRDFYEKHRGKLPKWTGRTWRLAGVGLVVATYAVAFAVQSVRAERFCLHDRHAVSFYVSPWSLSRYCTSDVSGRGYTFDASEQ